MRLPLRTLVLTGLIAAGAVALVARLDHPAHAQIAVRNQGYVQFSEAPINYRSADLHDPVTLLQHRLETGAASLTYDPQRGYLPSVLGLLHIPAASQTLVYSKTSFQFTRINPEHPRALYYNDDVYVGSVHQGKAIEVVSFDPNQGAIFYLLNEDKVAKPAFERAELDCTQCHIAAGTRGIPGVLMRSVYPSATGNLTPRAPQYITDQKSPLNQRWGGWYVTGALASPTMANSAATPVPVSADVAADQRPLPTLAPLGKTFDASAYLAPTSDPVALLVLAHQTQMHNLITLTNYRTRIALYNLGLGAGPSAAGQSLDALPEGTRGEITRPAEQLLRYLLFVGETKLGNPDPKPVLAQSAFARQFARQGPNDSHHRSLRAFDLRDRIFRYRCSYLIYSSAFDALPEPAKGYVYHRLLQVLSGEDQSPDFADLSAAERHDILTILLDTKPGLPAEWQDYARSHHFPVVALAPARPATKPS